MEELLRLIDLGAEVAEQDNLLDETFLRTPDYEEVATDRCDLILGAKGSGKSAIYRALFSQRDVDTRVTLVPGQASAGNLLALQDVPAGQELNPKYYMDRWVTHFCMLIIKEMLKRFPEDPRSRNISDRLLEKSISLDPGEAQAATWRTAGAASQRPGLTSETLSLAEDASRVFADHDARCWVVLDRIDNLNAGSPAREIAMLEGLLRAAVMFLDFGPTFKLKLFLRHDVFDRATRNRGIANLDHLVPLRLYWGPKDITMLLAMRLGRSADIRAVLGVHATVANDDWARDIVSRFVPTSAGRHQDVFRNMYLKCSDASRKYLPRNLLAWLRLVRLEEMRSTTCSEREVPTRGVVFSEASMQRAHIALSEERLQNQVFAEHNHLKRHLEKLSGGPYHYFSLHDLALQLQIPPDEDDRVRVVLEELVYAGVVETKNDEVTVASLYRPALLTDGRATRVGVNVAAKGQSRRLPKRRL